MNTIKTHNLGYPRIGEHRELKKATEAHWKGKLSVEELSGHRPRTLQPSPTGRSNSRLEST